MPKNGREYRNKCREVKEEEFNEECMEIKRMGNTDKANIPKRITKINWTKGFFIKTLYKTKRITEKEKNSKYICWFQPLLESLQNTFPFLI